MESETRATDTKAIQRTDPRLASGYSLVKAARATDVVKIQGTDCSLGLRENKREEKKREEKKREEKRRKEKKKCTRF